jgi:hypothetical protein
MTEVPTYPERISKRLRLWWQKPRDYRDPRTYRDFLHQLWELHTMRSRHDPEERWRCCRYWQRSLINKWNSREFAVRHGCRVPKLYWVGRSPRKLPFENLPDRYVIRPTFGRSRRGVYVICEGIDLLSGQAVRSKEMRRNLVGMVRRSVTGRILVEEFVGEPDSRPRLPVEVKMHMFGGHVGAISITYRSCVPGQTKRRFYQPDWVPFSDPIHAEGALADPIPAPPFLEELREAGTRLGRAYGTYARIDFLLTDGEIVFNEFSSTPCGGRCFTEFANEYFGRLWHENCPDEV